MVVNRTSAVVSDWVGGEGVGWMRHNRLPIIVAAAIGLLGLAVVIRLGLQAPETVPEKPNVPAAEPSGTRRSARVEERLQLLRETYARDQRARQPADPRQDAPQGGSGREAAAGAPPAAPEPTGEPGIARGRRAAWQR